MKSAYIFLIFFGTVFGPCILFNPLVKCYYYLFPYKQEHAIEV